MDGITPSFSVDEHPLVFTRIKNLEKRETSVPISDHALHAVKLVEGMEIKDDKYS